MKKHSAGLLVYRFRDGELQFLLAHMGSPWWAKKDKGAWSIPKGEYTDEEPLAAARREFKEEFGQEPPPGELIELGSIEQNNNKTVIAWAVEADLDTKTVKSNTVNIEWPPRSGHFADFPEIDRAGYFNLAEAAPKLVAGQLQLLERLAAKLNYSPPVRPEQSSLF
jgi:predicted NUDIX family NTP pyrophosphohydrolase